MKFLVLWSLEIRPLSEAMTKALLRQQDHLRKLDEDGKVESYFLCA